MNRIATSAIAAAAFFALGAAQASVTTFETASSSAGPQASAGAYQSVVDAAMTGASAQLLVVPAFDGLSNHGTFGGGTSDIAYRATITFGVTAGQAGSWDFRAGVDFGRGGAVFLDGVALAFNNNNMWWQGSYADTTQSFQFTTTVTAGNHTLKIVGLEDCCDAGDIGQQAQFRLVGGNFTTFGATDGLAAAVPEPGTYALMGFGLAGLAFAGRRRSAAKAA